MSLGRIKTKLFQSYWRFSRGLTIGAQAVILDERDHVLLVRHGYRPGWHFPGGGVEYNETVRVALEREIEEETGVALRGDPELHGIFANFKAFPGDHVALFIVREWGQIKEPELGFEIAEWGFFSRDDLPRGVSRPVTSRLAEIFDGHPVGVDW